MSKTKKQYDEFLRRLTRIETAIETIAQEKGQLGNLLSSNEVCHHLRISRRTLARLTSSGELSFTKSGRKLLFMSTDIEKFLESRKEGGSK